MQALPRVKQPFGGYRALTCAAPPARPGRRQGQLSTEEAIDSSTLEVRQLGDIYEGLLGAHFVREGARLELRNQNGKNHRHGILRGWDSKRCENLELCLAHRMKSHAASRRGMDAPESSCHARAMSGFHAGGMIIGITSRW
jgi:hypothetical protein